MTKEEAIKKSQDKNWGGYVSSHVIMNDAMDEYAKQTAIGFDIWKNSNYEPVEEGNYQGLFQAKYDIYQRGMFTTEQLYNLYKQVKA